MGRWRDVQVPIGGGGEKLLKTVSLSGVWGRTPLKRGVNEMARGARREARGARREAGGASLRKLCARRQGKASNSCADSIR